MASEPYVKVSIIDDTINLGTDPVDTSTNILVPVISPYGRSGCYKVSGASAFKKEYNNGNKVLATDHISMVTARGLSSHAPIYVKRVVRDDILGGINSFNNDNVYVDKETLTPISGALLSLKVSNRKTIAEMSSSIDKGIQFIAKQGENTASYSLGSNYFVGTKLTDGSKYIEDVDAFKTYKSTLFKTAELIKSTAAISIDTTKERRIDIELKINGTYSVTITSEDTMFDIFQLLIDNEIYPSHLIGKNIKYDVSTHTVTKLNENDSTINYIVFFDNDIQIKVNTEAEESDIYIKTTLPEKEGIACKKYIFYSEEDIISNYPVSTVDITLGLGEALHRYVKGDVTLDSTLSTVHKIPTTLERSYDIYKYILDSLNGLCSACSTGISTFVVPTLVSCSNGEKTEIAASIDTDINNCIEVADYAIVSLSPNAGNNIEIIVTTPDKTRTDIQHLVVNVNSESEEYDFSMVEGTVNGYGSDVSYTKVNDTSNFIRIVKLDGEEHYSSFTANIGGIVTNDYVDEDDMGNAIQEMIDEESNPVLFDYISDGGVVGNSSLISAIKNGIEEWKSFYVASCPKTSSLTELQSSITALGDTYTISCPGYCARTTDIDQGSVLMSGSYFYLVRRLELSNTNLEYTALFGDRGLLSITPYYKWKKAEREKLLDSRIPTLSPKITTSGTTQYYQNLDCTLQSTTSYLQDVDIVLMTNKICQITKNYGKTLIGHKNTRALRQDVETDLASLIDDRLRVGTENGPLGITILCNSVTTQSLIDRGYVKIEVYASFTRAIQNVLVYTHVQSITESSST